MSVRQTPLISCPALERELVASAIYLKLESLQITGSFKLRGATRALESLSREARARGVVTASAGNHGAGLARAAGIAGLSATVFVPTRTPGNKIDRMKSLGAELRIEGDDYDHAERLARDFAASNNRSFLSAFDDDEVLAGNGASLGAEILRQCPSVTRVLVPVGGGGLIAGMANELSPRGIDVIGAQPANNCAMHDSLALGRALCEYQRESTVAEGCEGAVCERTYAIVAKHGLSIGTVSEESIVHAVAFLYRECGVVAETSAAVPVAALREGAISPASSGATVVVISGANIDETALDEILSTHGS